MMYALTMTKYIIFLYGLLLIILHVHAKYEYEYVDNIYPLSLDYENENIIRHLLMDEDGDDEDKEDEDNNDDDDDYDNDNSYDDESEQRQNENSSDKRDLIKGPSYLRTIDDETADNDLEQENTDVQMGTKRKTIQRMATKGMADYVKPVASESDVSDAISSSNHQSSREEEKSGFVSKKSKGKINVLVNVNINERPARRSDVTNISSIQSGSAAYSGSSQFDVDYKPSSYLSKFGALQKLRGETDDETSGSGTNELKDDYALTQARNNQTINLFAGFAFPKANNQIGVASLANGASDNDSEDDDEEEAEEVESGSAEESATAKIESNKGSEEKTKTVAGNVNKTGDEIKTPFKVMKKYKPTHAYAETADAEKGETPDTVFASNIAADRMEKENELEHNDRKTESVKAVKDKETKKLTKENAEEIKTTEKQSFTKSAKPETEELADNVKTGQSKTPKAEAVGIEQVKDKNKKPKDIPKEAAIVDKVPEQPNMKVAGIDKEDEQNDELLFTKNERDDSKGKELIKDNVNNVKRKESTDDKYETLEEVREKFKNWENHLENNKKVEPKTKELDTKDSVAKTELNKVDVEPEQIHKEKGIKEKGVGSNEKVSSEEKKEIGIEETEKKASSLKERNSNEKTADKNDKTERSEETWKEEEKVLLQKLKNPYLDKAANKEAEKEDEDDDAERAKKEKEVEKETAEMKKNANAEFSSIVNKVTASDNDKSEEKETEEKEAAEVTASANKAFAAVVDKITKNTRDKEEEGITTGNKDSIKKSTKHVAEINQTATPAVGDSKVKLANQNIKQLQTFKDQILTEVAKIDNLQSEYGTDEHSTKDLSEAKDVLEKDLKVVKELENNLMKKAKSKKLKTAPSVMKAAAQSKQVLPTPSKRKGEDENDVEVIPDAKLGFDEPKKEKKKPAEKVSDVDDTAYEYTSKKPLEKHKAQKKKHPIEEIHSLLKAEIKRLRLNKGGKRDKQLSNIRKLVQNRLKTLISTGELDKTTFHTLTPAIKELGKLLKNRIKKERKEKKYHKKVKNNKAGRISNKAIDMMKDIGTERKPLDVYGNEQKIPQSGTVDNQLNKLQKEVSKVKPVLPNQNQNSASNNNTFTAPGIQQATHNISNAQDVFSQVKNNNISLNPSQSNKMKTLLTTLNQKLGEIYNKAQGASSTDPYQQQQQQQQQQQHHYSPYGAPSVAPDVSGSVPNVYVPSTYINSPSTQGYSQPSPQNLYNQPAEGKGELPKAEEDIDPDENQPKALADDEPVDTLVENLERDITEVWSYRDLFPDADALGLDNEKVHNTYANLGSLSGLNLRRALNRALRGEDVGLAIVGGSISKGGPFSEKGLDYVLRSYFYAIEDYWNKIIRPVTGSSMIIRDVSIGGIATDYYSYCLHNHLPDDKLTNIVLWELSANDMKRYDDDLKPKPQPLEQFTRNVLSYKAKPALMYLNFFALFDWDPELKSQCRNFEDEGEDDVAKYYKITSLSWRNMVCPMLKNGNSPLFTRSKLFAEDNFHPSILGHAQMSYIVIDYIRTEFLKNLVKMRNTYIADAVARLQIPKSVYIPRPLYPQTYTWKPLCYTYMLVDNRSPDNTLPIDENSSSGNFRYTVVREFKVRSDKIVGMETLQKDQFIHYRMHVPKHRSGSSEPYKRLGIMSFTDDRNAQVQFDNDPPLDLDSKKKFLEGTVIKYVGNNVTPGEHELTVRSGQNGFLICAIVLG